MKAIVRRDEALQMMSQNEPVRPVAGLSPPEIMLVALLAGGFTHKSTLSAYQLREDAERAGVTGVGLNLVVRRLLMKGYIEEVTEYEEHDQDGYTAYRLLDPAWEWIEENEALIVLQRSTKDDFDKTVPF